MSIIFDVYIVGLFVAFFLGCMLAAHYKEEEQQQLGLLAFVALMSWASVVILVYRYRSVYKRQMKWFFGKCKRLWCRFLIFVRDCQMCS